MGSLVKGENRPIEAKALDVAVRWDPGSSGVTEIDVSAFLLNASGKVRGDHDMVFYNQPHTPEGAVRITSLNSRGGGNLVETRFAIDLGNVPVNIDTISFAATISGGSAVNFGAIGKLQILVSGGADALDFDVPLGGATEVAMIVGEVYRRIKTWKFRAVGQGFKGGLKPLAEHMGVNVNSTAAPPVAPAAPTTTTTPPVAAPAAPISLSKITLTKANPSVDLTKKGGSYGEIKVNLNWNRNGGAPSRGFFSTGPKAVDLDLACLFQLQDGSLGAIQALGQRFGDLDAAPFIHLAGDDRTGQSVDGEWLTVNGRHFEKIRRVLIYTFIYDGAPNWAATDGVINVYAPEQPPIEVRLDEGRAGAGTCAIALIENVGGQLKVRREVQYFQDAELMDRHYRWGLRWSAGSKD